MSSIIKPIRRPSVKLHKLLLLFSIIFSLPWILGAATVDGLLRAEQPPSGVVFEILEGSKQDIVWAIGQVKEQVAALRKRFPDLEIAVVSHGREEFALRKSEIEDYKDAHSAVRSLVEDQAVPVHVCGTHASWYNTSPEDFPDYIDVAEVGPAQIADYENLGYVRVLVAQP